MNRSEQVQGDCHMLDPQPGASCSPFASGRLKHSSGYNRIVTLEPSQTPQAELAFSSLLCSTGVCPRLCYSTRYSSAPFLTTPCLPCTFLCSGSRMLIPIVSSAPVMLPNRRLIKFFINELI